MRPKIEWLDDGFEEGDVGQFRPFRRFSVAPIGPRFVPGAPTVVTPGICPPGTRRNLVTGQCETQPFHLRVPCPTGQTRDAAGRCVPVGIAPISWESQISCVGNHPNIHHVFPEWTPTKSNYIEAALEAAKLRYKYRNACRYSVSSTFGHLRPMRTWNLETRILTNKENTCTFRVDCVLEDMVWIRNQFQKIDSMIRSGQCTGTFLDPNARCWVSA